MQGFSFLKHQRSDSSKPAASTPFKNPPQPPGPEGRPSRSQPTRGRAETRVEIRDEGMLRLLEEIDANRKTARFSAGKLVPLQTEVWDASHRTIRALDSNLRRDLESIYSDIVLLNQLVWLSSEFRRSNRALLSQYADLSLVIAKRLDEIVESPRYGLAPT